MLIVAATGCGGGNPDSGPFGPSQDSPLLAPFAGEWTCDFEKTFEAFKAAGTSDEQIEQLRNFYGENPRFGNIHPDINITGDVAVSPGVPSSEYRFFAMHEHQNKVCGKAWHHEDRFDPGDMSKCYVRLTTKDDCLYLEVRMKDGLPDLNDPDLRSSAKVESGSAANCDADNPPGPDWSEWTTYVFSRKP
jgi:hypothetical protein